MERNKIRVLYIGPIPPEVGGRFYGGVATHLWELATQASKRGYDVHVLADDAILPTSKLIIRNIDNVKIIIPPTHKLVKALKAIRFSLVAMQLKLDVRFLHFFDFKEMLFILYLADVLREVIDTIKPNLIHVHSLFNSFNLALRIVNPPIPIIITDHGAYWEVRKQRKGLLKLGLALSIPSLRKVICVSKHVREKLLRFHTVLSKYFPTLISPDNIVVIHNPIDTTRFPTLDPEKLKELKRKIGRDKKIVMFCAVTEPIRRKRLDLLLKAFTANDYLRNSCRLIIVSNEEGVSYARRFASQNKLDLMVLSRVPWKELVEYYAIADVLAMPSYAEPFSLVYIEALSLGTPIVGSYENIKELEELLGIYIGEKFDPRHEDERKLAEKIVRVLTSSIDRELLRRRIHEKLSWEAKFKEYDSIYKEVLFNDMDTKVFNR
jgi:glycosyltransferase involved in cell wall biosynthesis